MLRIFFKNIFYSKRQASKSSEINRRQSTYGDIFDKLPAEMIERIYSYLTIRDLVRLSGVNKQFKNDIDHFPVEASKLGVIGEHKTTYYQLKKEFQLYSDKRNEILALENKCLSELNCIKKRWSPYHMIEAIESIAILLISISGGIYVGHVFYGIFDSYFVAIENGILATPPIFFGTMYMASEYLPNLRFIADKISRHRYNEREQLEEGIEALKKELSNLPQPTLMQLGRKR